MDQIKIGKFISETRKTLGITQRQLADALFISDKTVSKWECGKGLPEVSLMLPLCEELHITVNELLTGEKIEETEYKKKAEENMMNLVQENQENRKNDRDGKKETPASLLKTTVPSSGCKTPAIVFNKVDFPVPLRPISAAFSPSCSPNVTPVNKGFSRPIFERLLIESKFIF